jgi:asparagine synthase (glutamine-hydrolysing)
MCGIAGIYARGDAPIALQRLLAMRDDQVHRGPEAVGLRTGPHIGLAFNRLAIIDLSPEANQPMVSEDDGTWIVFNGEIYNFRNLREDLETRGYRFRTQADTEVILQGYRMWGVDVVNRLNGMFAFALWDAPKETLYLVRDRVGKKPLFYRDSQGEVVFASEVRALIKGLTGTPPMDMRALDAYLSYLCVPGESSIYQGVRKVPPASVVTCTRQGLRIDRYWRLSFRNKVKCTEQEAIDHLDELLEDATRLRMIADVPVGAFLSGGVDSSTVVAMMNRIANPVRTFSVGFADEALDELPHSRAVSAALRTRHVEMIVEPNAAAILPKLVWHYGEPFADSSAVPTYYLAEVAREDVKVALNGDGGDEGFVGYPWNRTIQIAEAYRRFVPRAVRRGILAPIGSVVGRLSGAPHAAAALARLLAEWGERSPADLFWIWPGFGGKERLRLFLPSILSQLDGSDPSAYCRAAFEAGDGPNDLDRCLQVIIETYLPDDILVKIDIASMAHSLEARSPLLDHRVLEFTASLPASLKFKRYRTKHLLKKVAARLVPRSTVYRPKKGFAPPLAAWLRGSLRRPVEVLLGHPRFHKRGLFSPPVVQSYIDKHMAGEDHSEKLWALLWLELWFRMFVDGDLSRQDSLRHIA